MRSRKPYSLVKRKPKKGHVYHYRFYDETGRRNKRNTGQTTIVKAHEYVLSLLNKGSLVSEKKEKELPVKGITTFKDFAEEYFVWGKCDYILERNNFGGKSISKEHAYTERQYLVNWIRPYFKSRDMETISINDIKSFVFYLKKKGTLSDGTINHILKLVKMVFSKAHRDEVIEKIQQKDSLI